MAINALFAPTAAKNQLFKQSAVNPSSILNSLLNIQFTHNLQRVMRAQRACRKCLKPWEC